VNKIPTVIATWPNLDANAAAWNSLSSGGSALDAVEAGARYAEADPRDKTVGYGGRPDREGNVTLDACIMDHAGNCGSVCFLQGIKHPISVARKVMEDTPHVMLAGQGALEFALSKGFTEENLLTGEAEAAWKVWLETAEYKPVINIENHDTIAVLAVDQQSDLAGACTTSGAAYKMKGRVGDSPLIGSGLYVDSDAGAAAGTGLGEAVMKTAGGFHIVEMMRQGKSPQQACEEAIGRIVAKQPYKEFQVGYIAVNADGETGAFSIQPGFNYVVYTNGVNKMFTAGSYIAASP